MRTSRALNFVVLLGIVSLFADMTYEGARSAVGPFLGMLGASAFAIGIVSGGGELVGCGLRLWSGRSDAPLLGRWQRVDEMDVCTFDRRSDGVLGGRPAPRAPMLRVGHAATTGPWPDVGLAQSGGGVRHEPSPPTETYDSCRKRACRSLCFLGRS
jgi:hypothetical protein